MHFQEISDNITNETAIHGDSLGIITDEKFINRYDDKITFIII